MKSPGIILFFIFLFAIIAYIVFFASAQPLELHYPVEKPPICEDGQKKSCMVDNCTGTSICEDNSWSVCSWERVCDPGSRIACVENGCAIGYRECNECGTGYSPCPVVAKT